MLKQVFMCTLIFLLSSNLTYAKIKPVSQKYYGPEFNSSYVLPEVNEPKIVERIKNSESKRRPANTSSLDESMMSVKLKEIIKRVHTLKTSEDFEAVLTELNSNYDSYPNDVKFYITQVETIKSFRGIAYRLAALLEKKSNFLHSQILTQVKKIAANSNVLLPYQHIKAGFEYITSPYITANGKLVETFKDEKEIQNYIATEIIPALIKSTKRLEALDLTEPVIWDQRATYGDESFIDNIKRFKLIGEFEKNIALGASYSSLSSLAILVSYNVDKAFDLYKDIGFLFGFDGFGILNAVNGVSSEKISKVIRKPQFEHIGTLLPTGAKWMSFAYISSQRAMKRLNDAWTNSEIGRVNGDSYIVNTDFLNINRENITDNIKTINRIIWSKDIESLRSTVTGEVIQINYHEWFSNPPKDLKAFLPIAFETGKNVSRKIVSGVAAGRVVSYRNYTEGMAKAYNVASFAPYFPNIKTQDDVFKTARVLSHMNGDWLKLAK